MRNDWWQRHFPNGRQSLTIQDANGRKVSIAYGSVGSGPPLFLLHGIGSWSYNWRYNITPLAQHFQVFCVDAKGYGFSETPPFPEIVGHQVIELSRMIEALVDRPVMLAGESLGALTALGMTQSHPEWVERLVLINIPVFPKQLPNVGMQLLSYLPMDLVQWVDRNRWIRPFEPIVQEMVRWVRHEVVVDPNQITEEDIYWLTYPYLHIPGTLTQFAIDLQHAAQEIERLHRQESQLLHPIQQNLAQVACPTLVMWSECDQWFPVSDGERLINHLPNARLQIIPNCGHVASSGNPEVVNRAIVEHCVGVVMG